MSINNNKFLCSVLSAYGLKDESLNLESFGSGLINNTWKVVTPEKEYILQRINDDVFKQPEDICHNISCITQHLKYHHPDYYFVSPMTSQNGKEMIYKKDQGFFRIFPFVLGSHSKDVVQTPEQAYEASIHFARFTRLLSNLKTTELKITIPSFHDLTHRYQQFVFAVMNGDKKRLSQAEALVKTLISFSDIVRDYENIKQNPEFKQRLMHHDTKISNILFNEEDKGICVIDLDTAMPGYFISDVGDMMRTYLSPVGEEERDFSAIKIRKDFYKAIVSGYYKEMKDELTDLEKKYFFYAGKFIIYMQALRFLTDHLNNDIYYGAKYTDHNLIRAGNQAMLLQRLMEEEDELADFRG